MAEAFLAAAGIFFTADELAQNKQRMDDARQQHDEDEDDDDETRIAPDGFPYTKQQFLDHFGGLVEWNTVLVGSATTAPLLPRPATIEGLDDKRAKDRRPRQRLKLKSVKFATLKGQPSGKANTAAAVVVRELLVNVDRGTAEGSRVRASRHSRRRDLFLLVS